MKPKSAVITGSVLVLVIVGIVYGVLLWDGWEFFFENLDSLFYLTLIATGISLLGIGLVGFIADRKNLAYSVIFAIGITMVIAIYFIW